MRAIQPTVGFSDIQVDEGMAKLSIIGVGMRSHADVAHVMFQTLADLGVQLHAISTSEIKISVLIDADHGDAAVRALHAAYGLAEPA